MKRTGLQLCILFSIHLPQTVKVRPQLCRSDIAQEHLTQEFESWHLFCSAPDWKGTLMLTEPLSCEHQPPHPLLTGPVNTSAHQAIPQVLGCIQQNKSFLFLNRILITHSLALWFRLASAPKKVPFSISQGSASVSDYFYSHT